MLRSAAWAHIWAVVRVLTAIGGLAAIIAQLGRAQSNADAGGRPIPTVIANFFGFSPSSPTSRPRRP